MNCLTYHSICLDFKCPPAARLPSKIPLFKEKLGWCTPWERQQTGSAIWATWCSTLDIINRWTLNLLGMILTVNIQGHRGGRSLPKLALSKRLPELDQWLHAASMCIRSPLHYNFFVFIVQKCS